MTNWTNLKNFDSSFMSRCHLYFKALIPPALIVLIFQFVLFNFSHPAQMHFEEITQHGEDEVS